jgi:acetyltransferase-like isoleucine patch superfamily enzyme
MIDVTQKEKLPKNDQDVIIGNDVWIGSNVVILKGSVISDGAIIGAGCIVNGQVDPYTIVVGNKDRKILKRFKDSELKEHLHLLS